MVLLIVIIVLLVIYKYAYDIPLEGLWGQVWAFDLTSGLGVLLYWIPFFFCTFGYPILIYRWYQKDLKNRMAAVQDAKDWNAEHQQDPGYKPREASAMYTPSLTLGDIIWRFCLTVVPLMNIGAACFHVFPDLFEDFYEWLKKTFDIPLVPTRKDK